MSAGKDDPAGWTRAVGLAVLLVGAVYLLYSNRRPDVPVAPVPVAPAGLKLLVVTQPGCAPCAALKRDFPGGFGLPCEWLDNSADVTLRWKIDSVPTLILVDGKDDEVRRLVGYGGRAEVEAFLRGRVSVGKWKR